MNTTLANALGLIAALAVGWWAVATVPGPTAASAHDVSCAADATVTTADGRPAVRDARGIIIPCAAYRRIASLGIQSDALLVELCEPERLVAASAWSVGPWAHRLGAVPRLRGFDDLETLIALKPDVVLVSTFGGDLDRLSRLREAGLTVCDLGPQGGVTSLVDNARLLGRLLGIPERGERFAVAFPRRMAAVAATLPESARRSAVYVQCIGDQLFGGAAGTSFHDVLTAAGLRDVARGFTGWPQYAVEQLITLDPDLMVTQRGGAATLRRLPGISAMRAARDPRGIVELDVELLQCPGPVMLDAAEILHAQVYGDLLSGAGSSR